MRAGGVRALGVPRAAAEQRLWVGALGSARHKEFGFSSAHPGAGAWALK